MQAISSVPGEPRSRLKKNFTTLCERLPKGSIEIGPPSMEQESRIPLVICGGFLQPNPHTHYMYPKCEVPPNICMITPDPSCVGSLHDRVCQIFYQLVGGTVDYGEEHSSFHQHSRFGRSYETGLYPRWSEDNPVYLLGHSMVWH